ncbi:MAG: diaminopimelate decarboxylase [Candidatus Saccharimonadales bacterium]
MNTSLPFTHDDIKRIAEQHPTPFHIYDEQRIRDVARRLSETMERAGVSGFRNFFAVKALPNPAIVRILAEEGMGADCSSLAELKIAEMAGLRDDDIMFSSNNTPDDEFTLATAMGAIINFDDVSQVAPYLEKHGPPSMACCRFNPGDLEFGGLNQDIIGSPREAKYGMPVGQMVEAYRQLKAAGVTKFGLHTMLLSNELDWRHHEMIADRLFAVAVDVAAECGITFDFINLGGGIGVPYRPTEHAFDLAAFADSVSSLYVAHQLHAIGSPRIVMENGRAITADSGYLVTRVRTIKRTHKTYIGVDASMSDLMRPAMYGAYHHITVLNDSADTEEVDVVGSLCENNDKFAIDRELPRLNIGDIIIIHTTGAHGHAMGFQYNGKLRHAELLWRGNGDVRQIRRAETVEDYLGTVTK